MPARVHFLRHAALAFVRAHDSGQHAHRAVQLTVGLTGPFRLREEAAGGWRETGFAALAPQQPHRVQADAAPLAYLFVDRGPRAWEAWRAAGQSPLAPPAALVARLHAAAARGCDDATAAALAAAWEAASLPGLGARDPAPDARIAAALSRIEADPAAPVNHRVLAQAAHLSVSRFAELFGAATGMPVRNYLLWRRLLRAVELLQGGAAATAAAHAAGFADAAHLARSFRRVLGSAPSDIEGGVPGRARRGSGI